MDTGSKATVAVSEETETRSKNEEEEVQSDPVEDQETIKGVGPPSDDINPASEDDDGISSSPERPDMSETGHGSCTNENLGIERTEFTEVDLSDKKGSLNDASLEIDRDESEKSDDGDDDDQPSLATSEAANRSGTSPASKLSPATGRTDVLERAGVLLKKESRRREEDDFIEGDIASPSASTVASGSSVQVDSVTGVAITNGTNERHVRFADDIEKIPENGGVPSTEQESGQTQQDQQV